MGWEYHLVGLDVYSALKMKAAGCSEAWYNVNTWQLWELQIQMTEVPGLPFEAEWVNRKNGC
jgi:hypothetical protein